MINVCTAAACTRASKANTKPIIQASTRTCQDIGTLAAIVIIIAIDKIKVSIGIIPGETEQKYTSSVDI